MLGAQTLQRTHLNTDQVGVEDPHQDIGRVGRVGQRTQDVEDGAHAQFFADGRNVHHRRVVVRRKHEADADLFNAARNRLRRQIELDAKRLNDIGAARAAADAAPAMLADLGARRRRHKHRTGRNIESVRPVTASAHNVHQMRLVGNVHLGRKLAHHLRSSGDLANGFLLDAQAGDERSHQHRRHFAAHDEPHDVQHFVVKNLTVFNGALQRLLRRDLRYV